MIRLAALVTLTFALSGAASASEFGLEGLVNYSDASAVISLDGKKAKYKLGAAGANLFWRDDLFGKLSIGAGVGYSPEEQASFLSITASGSAQSKFVQFSYENRVHLNRNLAIGLALNHKQYNIEGDLSGEFNDSTLAVRALSDFILSEAYVTLEYHFSEATSLNLGAGILDWEIDALAEGSIASGIQAKTRAFGSNQDPMFIFQLKTEVLSFPVSFAYKHSSLSADEKIYQQELLFHIELLRL